MSDSGLLALDAAARGRALDSTRSFIVRAPAGSGKTELLIQRVLKLLSTVDTPEEVVAITFTRKAAAEMRQRLVSAMETARICDEPGEEHERRTYRLAREVCERDAARGWDIVANPGRLRIQTIDALAHSLARQLPLTMRLGAAPNVTERAEELYAAAARATLMVLDSTEPGDRAVAPHVERLLEHLDNDVERVIALLSAMLARRDQWLRHLGEHERDKLESTLRRASVRHMRRVCALLPAHFAEELVSLARYAADNLGAGSAMSPCTDLDGLPGAEAERLDAWCALAGMLLTKDGSWRSRYTRADGFPAGTSASEKREARPYQERIKALIEALGDYDELRVALDELRALPPSRFADTQWELVEAIVGVLPRAAAELALVFAETGSMDFAEVTQRAVRAMGDERAGDIAIALDARIGHLLIDEFQDTSITQFELVERLVAEWTPGDGRTLFVVGDPMQSIYRFREAEVALFLRAWEWGIGSVTLEPLQLARNFRSQQGVVEWVNRSFARVLPATSDFATGAVSFEPAAAVHPTTASPAVIVHPFVGGSARDEASRVVDIVRSIRTVDASATIALLVRARTHLVEIAAALRNAGLQPTAVELRALDTRPLVSDLLSLTRALEHGADRTAWLAVLRAPWCGLTLADLAALCEGARHRTVQELLADEERLGRLSQDGRARLMRVVPVLQRAVALKERVSAAVRVEHAWLALGGPACMSSAAERADAEQFFEFLAQHEQEQHGRIDPHGLQQSLRRLFAGPDAGADPKFHVMTIHKAKGLEFDHVIVPRLSATTRSDEPALMLWLERAAEEGDAELLMAPIHAAGREKDALERWVCLQLQERQRREDERLAYVAATRARECLHWIGCARHDAKRGWSVPDTSLLARLWPIFEADFERAVPIEKTNGDAGEGVLIDQSFRRLPSGWSMPALPRAVDWVRGDAPADMGGDVDFSWAGETARRVGVVVHRWLQRMAEDGLAGWDRARLKTIAPQIERALAAGGLSGAELRDARARVAQALENVLTDERGRWVLGAHPEHRSELRLSALRNGRVRHLVLDRTFLTTDRVRWIVDYKVGAHEGADMTAFLDSERVRYGAQLQAYAAALDPSARLGLYFPLVPGWREWSAADLSTDELRNQDE